MRPARSGRGCASRLRKATIRATIGALTGIVARLEADGGGTASVGVGMPGIAVSDDRAGAQRQFDLAQRAAAGRDVSTALGRPVRFANDANCFALSEAVDGAGRDAHSRFRHHLGTGCGGGIVIERRLIEGAARHRRRVGPQSPALGPRATKSGAALLVRSASAARDLDLRHGPRRRSRADRRASAFQRKRSRSASTATADAKATLARHAGRVGRGLAHVVNIVDPDVIVIGGGLSHLEHLYRELPGLHRAARVQRRGERDRAAAAMGPRRRPRRRVALERQGLVSLSRASGSQPGISRRRDSELFESPRNGRTRRGRCADCW